MNDILTRLRKNKVKVALDGGNIKLSLPENFQNNELLAEIKENKKKLIQHIKLVQGKTFSNISKAAEQAHYPLSSAQRRMYFLYEFDKESLNYNIPAVYNISGSLDTALLNEIFKKITDRHEILRTNFMMNDGEVVQKIIPSDSFEVSYFSCSKSESEDVIKEFVRPFDLSTGYPFRVGLITIKEGEHILVLDQHHIVSDGLSREILINDFWSLYKGMDLPPLRLQYKDYAVWQQDEPQQELMAKDKEFWLSEYKEQVAGLELPSDHDRPMVKSGKGDSVKFQIEVNKAQKIAALTQKLGLIPFVFFTSVYTILLNKLSGQEDIVVGTPTLGRHHVDLEGIVGMFVNTIPLRNRVNTGLPFLEYLECVKECILNCFDHQLYQYNDLIDELGLERNTSRNPLFDTFISYKKHEVSTMAETVSDEEGLSIETIGLDRSISKFDLSLNLVESAEGFNCGIEYSTDLFEEETIRKYANYLELLVDQILEDPNVKLSELTLLSEEEYDAIVHGFNSNDKPYGLDQTLTDLFHQQVTKTPDAVALRFHEEEVTYQELKSRSDILAKHIGVQGVQNGDVIGMCMDRSINMMVTILGILKSGCGYLPLDPSQPLSRKEFQLYDSNASLVITSQNYEATFSGAKILLIDALDWDNVPEVNFDVQIDSNSLAYVIYTSGSTGNPKGVGVKHRGVVNLVQSQQTAFGISDTDRILQFSPIYFDASVEQIWLSLLSGGTLVLIDEETLLDQQRLNAYLAAHGVTHFHATPSFLETLELDEHNDLKRIVAGGEACKPSLASKFEVYDFYNEYGPTETTITTTMYKVGKATQDNASIPIGIPINNMKAYVLDTNKKVVPVGVVGELYLSGPGLSDGYINRPELTAEVFVENPFSNASNAKLYKTGDLVRWLPDGNLEFLGRKDYQVKIRGYRIELGEIEAKLQALEPIQQAVVEVKETTAGGKQLVGYLTTNEEIGSPEIMSQLKEHLPEFMVPQAYVMLAELPMTPSGKVDRKALPDPEINIEAYVAPSTKVERQLVGIWAAILEMEEQEIGVTQSFFEIGGHSLKAINLTNKIKEVFSIEISLKEIFQNNTVSALAEIIDDYSWLNDEQIDQSDDKANQENEEFGIII